MGFKEKWLDSVKEKNSVLVAGIDPAPFRMGRGPKGLPEETNKLEWTLDYVKAVAPYCAAVKPNIQYWKDSSDMEGLKKIVKFAKERGLLVIEDSKLADIGSTNDAGWFYAREKEVDAVTFSPFAGNIGEAAKQAESYGLGIITMCLMSNPQFEKEKNKLVEVDPEGYREVDIVEVEIDGEVVPHVRQYVKSASDAKRYGAEMVIGAPSENNHITDEEIETARLYAGEETLVLLPGVGAQGGEADLIWNHFGPERVMVNVGRGLMLANGSKTTHEEQAETAREYRETLNRLRAKDF